MSIWELLFVWFYTLRADFYIYTYTHIQIKSSQELQVKNNGFWVSRQNAHLNTSATYFALLSLTTDPMEVWKKLMLMDYF